MPAASSAGPAWAELSRPLEPWYRPGAGGRRRGWPGSQGLMVSGITVDVEARPRKRLRDS